MGMTHERHVSLRTTCLRCFTPVTKIKESVRKNGGGFEKEGEKLMFYMK